jgi:ribosomal protein S18 acetylase RimI-like enzyme
MVRAMVWFGPADPAHPQAPPIDELKGTCMTVRVIEADYHDPLHAEHIVLLTNAYAQDVMGGATPLPDSVCRELVPRLREMPGALSFLAYEDDRPVGVANCFVGFSTFKARPLINVHDLGVVHTARGRGVGKALLDAVAEKSRMMGGCKVTLEVLESNHARRLYEREGFRYGEPRYLFMSRPLD